MLKISRLVNVLVVLILALTVVIPANAAPAANPPVNKGSGNISYDTVFECFRYTGENRWSWISTGGANNRVYNWAGSGWFQIWDHCKNVLVDNGSYAYRQHEVLRDGQSVVYISRYRSEYANHTIKENWTMINGIIKNDIIWIDGIKMGLY